MWQRPAKNKCPASSSCGRAAITGVAVMSSGKTIRSGWVVSVGWWEFASAALCHTPGMCTMWNQYHKVFSLRLRSLALVISSRDLSPNTLSRGLWSTALIRLLQPRTKKRALSRAFLSGHSYHSPACYNRSTAHGCLHPCDV